ncbi:MULTISPECIES: extracellular solute-binding protein [unclassified Pseudomonas]|uniref:extracellular solute-binding protein n=1 Tax=unclassified Pseudomonas TaxID=196821 RepID=UPI0030DB261D
MKINYDLYDSNEVLEAKLMSGITGCDVVVPSGSYLERQAKAGIYTILDKGMLMNNANLDPAMMHRLATHAPDNSRSVPYAWGTVGLGYNVDKVKARLGDVLIDRLNIIFDPKYAAKLAGCGIAMLDSPSEVMAIALNYSGLDPSSEDKTDLRKASDLVAKVKPHIRYFHSSKYLGDLANGDICMALGYGSDVLMAKNRASEAGNNVNVHYAVPKEGTLVWCDLMAIPADAPHPKEAYQFIDFLLRSQSAASISNHAYAAVAYLAALPFLKKEVAGDPGVSIR